MWGENNGRYFCSRRYRKKRGRENAEWFLPLAKTSASSFFSDLCDICGNKIANDLSENEISYLIRGVIFKIFKRLGPGLYEKVYTQILKYELEKLGLEIKTEVFLPVVYDDMKFEIGYKIDLLINDIVIIEVKSIERLLEVHHKQTLTYLKLTGLKLALLVNFNSDNIVKDIIGKVNNL